MNRFQQQEKIERRNADLFFLFMEAALIFSFSAVNWSYISHRVERLDSFAEAMAETCAQNIEARVAKETKANKFDYLPYDCWPVSSIDGDVTVAFSFAKDPENQFAVKVKATSILASDYYDLQGWQQEETPAKQNAALLDEMKVSGLAALREAGNDLLKQPSQVFSMLYLKIRFNELITMTRSAEKTASLMPKFE